MEVGDIFTVDQAAIDEMEKGGYSVVWKDKQKNTHPLPVGTQFRITKDGIKGLPVEVRASKIDPVTNKCGKGRPRRFPAGLVYRLLGETPPAPKAPADDFSVAPVAPTAPTVSKSVQRRLAVQMKEPIVSSDDTPETAKVEQVEQSSAEDDAARQSRVEELLGLLPDKGTDNDWL